MPLRVIDRAVRPMNGSAFGKSGTSQLPHQKSCSIDRPVPSNAAFRSSGRYRRRGPAPVELREELGQGGDADDDDSAGTNEPAEGRQGCLVVVEMLDHVEGQNGVERGSARPWSDRADASGPPRSTADQVDRGVRAPGEKHPDRLAR